MAQLLLVSVTLFTPLSLGHYHYGIFTSRTDILSISRRPYGLFSLTFDSESRYNHGTR
jgi:hypothetical protein